MRRVAVHTIVVAAIGLGGAGLGGCVQQDTHDRALMTARTKDEQIARLQEELEVAQANLATVRAQAKTDIEALQTQVGDLETAFDSESRKSERWLRRVSQFGPLPLELEAAIEGLAEDYPDLLSFDATTGTLQFAGDFTFAKGSAQVTPEAAPTVATLADILNSPKAANVEIQLIGHTDNVPIERYSTKQRHPTNVHLSAHRAIAVRDALVDAGIAPIRIMVAGYGEFRPLVANAPKKGAAGNRRVEMVLVPMIQRSAEAETDAASALPEIPSK
jgi:chemotaxis protein MotB